MKIWENEKCYGNTIQEAIVSTAFSRNVVHVFYFLNAGENLVKNVVMISIILDKIAQPCYFGAKIGECCSTVCIMYFVGV